MKNKNKHLHPHESTHIILSFIIIGFILGTFFISQSITGLTVDTPTYANSGIKIIGLFLIVKAIALTGYLVYRRMK